MRSKQFFIAGLVGFSLSNSVVRAQSQTRLSEASTKMSTASSTIVAGSTTVITGSGQLMVTGIEAAGESLLVTLKGASDAGTVVLKISSAVAGAASLAVGTTVTIFAEATGYMLTASGKLLAFIPNEVGQSLLHHAQQEK